MQCHGRDHIADRSILDAKLQGRITWTLLISQRGNGQQSPRETRKVKILSRTRSSCARRELWQVSVGQSRTMPLAALFTQSAQTDAHGIQRFIIRRLVPGPY